MLFKDPFDVTSPDQVSFHNQTLANVYTTSVFLHFLILSLSWLTCTWLKSLIQRLFLCVFLLRL